jgi:hypothetical protein
VVATDDIKIPKMQITNKQICKIVNGNCLNKQKIAKMVKQSVMYLYKNGIKFVVVIN